eukprot:COSAG02_NODE_60696_length_270_cov_1.181287_1_plen_35_part_10
MELSAVLDFHLASDLFDATGNRLDGRNHAEAPVSI